MKHLPFLLAALLAAPVVSAQTDRMDNRADADQTDADRMGMDPQMSYQADIDRLGRDLDQLDRSMTGEMRGDYTTYRESYDELREMTSQTDMPDPVAARQSRMDYDRRYDELAGTVYRARLSSARTRADYVDAANDRIGAYDDQIRDLRTGYDTATGNARADRAQDLIGLRRQRDAYRDQVYSTRGTTRTGFDDARRRATDALTRADTDFSRARREAMTRSMDGGMDRPATDGSRM